MYRLLHSSALPGVCFFWNSAIFKGLARHLNDQLTGNVAISYSEEFVYVFVFILFLFVSKSKLILVDVRYFGTCVSVWVSLQGEPAGSTAVNMLPGKGVSVAESNKKKCTFQTTSCVVWKSLEHLFLFAKSLIYDKATFSIKPTGVT